MQAIVTKFISPTDFKGSRIKAAASAGSVEVTWDDELNVEDNHRKAAFKLQEKLGWVGDAYGDIKGGTMPNEDMCWVMVPASKSL